MENISGFNADCIHGLRIARMVRKNRRNFFRLDKRRVAGVGHEKTLSWLQISKGYLVHMNKGIPCISLLLPNPHAHADLINAKSCSRPGCIPDTGADLPC